MTKTTVPLPLASGEVQTKLSFLKVPSLARGAQDGAVVGRGFCDDGIVAKPLPANTQASTSAGQRKGTFSQSTPDKRLGWAGLATIILAMVALFSCNQDTPKNLNNAPTPKMPELMAPFRFHKMIEVAPGQDFDVMSWGRGSNTTGSLLILRSDSAGKKYTTTTGDLEGAITDVFNSDMDIDGNPELLIEAKAKDTIAYTTIYAYEFNADKANKLDFPKLTTTQKTGYRGADNFYMKDGKLIREFPLYDGNTATAKATGKKRVLQYNLKANSLTVKDLSADTLKTGAPKVDTVAKKPVEKKKTTKAEKKSTKHHHEEPKKKKKKHHRSDD